jgi:hypothetical protein
MSYDEAYDLISLARPQLDDVSAIAKVLGRRTKPCRL